MKWRTIWGFGLGILLFGCQQATSLEPTETQSVANMGEGRVISVDYELTYIESLIGRGDLESAKVALEGLLFTMNGTAEGEFQQARINTLLTLLETVDVGAMAYENTDGGSEGVEGEVHTDFTGPDAVTIAMNYLEGNGNLILGNDDYVFMFHDTPSHFGTDQIGYYVAVKSRQLLETTTEDEGIIYTLFVTNRGEIEFLDLD